MRGAARHGSELDQRAAHAGGGPPQPGSLLDGTALAEAKQDFAVDWARVSTVTIDAGLCEAAADLAETTGVKTLDALHLAAAQLAGADALVTFDARLARAAGQVGVDVAGFTG